MNPPGAIVPAADALKKQAEGSPGTIAVIELDVLSEESANNAVAQIVDEAWRLNVVAHNAAHLLFGITEAFSPEEVLRAYDVTAVGARRVNRAALPVLRRQVAGW